jgi:hypothetical protein
MPLHEAYTGQGGGDRNTVAILIKVLNYISFVNFLFIPFLVPVCFQNLVFINEF